MNRNITGLSVIVLFATAAAFAQNEGAMSSRSGDPAAGKSKSLLCQGCHGEDGNSLASLVPKLAGQNTGYIVKQVHNFQSGARTHPIMNDLAATVNDDDLVDIAAYFAAQKKMKGDVQTNDRAGKDLFLSGDPSRGITACASCHGANGKGLEPNPSMIPVIGGQNRDYLNRQLANFRKNDRKNSPGNVMFEITRTLTDAEIGSLADYVAGQ